MSFFWNWVIKGGRFVWKYGTKADIHKLKEILQNLKKSRVPPPPPPPNGPPLRIVPGNGNGAGATGNGAGATGSNGTGATGLNARDVVFLLVMFGVTAAVWAISESPPPLTEADEAAIDRLLAFGWERGYVEQMYLFYGRDEAKTATYLQSYR